MRLTQIKHLTFPTLIQYQLAIFFFLFPLFFLPNFSDFYQLPKTILTLLIATTMIITVIIHSLKHHQLTLKNHPLYLPVALMLISFLLSTFLQSPNPSEAWTTPGLLLFGLATIYFISTNFLHPSHLSLPVTALLFSSALLSLMAIYQLFGLTQSLPHIPSWLADQLWNPTGSPVSLIFILFTTLVFTLSRIIHRRLHLVSTGLYLFLVLIQALALAATVYQLLPGKYPLVHLPYSIGYSIAIDTLKNWRTALIGFGPANYLSAFTRFKPLAYNQLDQLWNVRFASASNQYFHILTTSGLLGLVTLIFISYQLLLRGLKLVSTTPAWTVNIFALLIFLALFSLNLTTLILFFVILIGVSILTPPAKSTEISLNQILPLASLSIFFLLLIGNAWFYTIQYSIADHYFRRSLSAIDQKHALDTYQYQAQAINHNPHQVSYRIAYSRTNLAFATALAKQDPLPDSDRQQVIQLIQQAIAEAKTAVKLNPQNVNTWEHLALTYKQLINTATNADQFALQAYNQALRLDPRHPRLWVEYGGLLQSLNQIENATSAFRQATLLKPNYANAHYNLALAYQAQSQPVPAYQEIQKVLSLIDPQTQAYTIASQLAQELKDQAEKSLQSLPASSSQAPGSPTSPESTLTAPTLLEPLNQLETIPLPDSASPQELLSPESSPPSTSTNPSPTSLPNQDSNQQ